MGFGRAILAALLVAAGASAAGNVSLVPSGFTSAEMVKRFHGFGGWHVEDRSCDKYVYGRLWDADCMKRRPPAGEILPLLVTGTPYTGTRSIAELFAAMDVEVDHEAYADNEAREARPLLLVEDERVADVARRRAGQVAAGPVGQGLDRPQRAERPRLALVRVLDARQAELVAHDVEQLRGVLDVVGVALRLGDGQEHLRALRHRRHGRRGPPPPRRGGGANAGLGSPVTSICVEYKLKSPNVDSPCSECSCCA